ncbi:MAG: amino acid adenylation domain-containing protein [Niastella sp.]|uniref:amino acid adenylation domain-containing protein n=1 Tax=Niastella sp. TaxID=1869183 RepID=UPI003899870E
MFFQKELKAALAEGNSKAAIEYDGKSIARSALYQTSEAITACLLSKGVEKETVIGILLNDRVDLISAMIGVINARCVFVLIDSKWPAARRASLISDLDLQHLICPRSTGELPVAEIYYFEDIISSVLPPYDEPAYDGGDSLYIYFTSGSTGRPKGIVGRNDSLLHFIKWEIDEFGLNSDCRCSQFISPFFDAFLRDIFVPLLAGGTICIPPPEDDFLQPLNLIDWIDGERITQIHCVPSLFRTIIVENLLPNRFISLKYILLSGEKIIPSELIRWYAVFHDRIQLVNLYGPSETTMIRSCYRLMPADAHQSRIPIGYPISGTTFFLFDKNGRPCSTLVPGELYIQTAYSTKGYLNAPELTGEKFVVVNPDEPDEKICFKTGDIARRLPDGRLDLIGREDRQIKLNGIRIEPDEIETALIRSGLVKSAVVVLQNGQNGRAGNGSLIAFVITSFPTDTHPDGGIETALRQYLEAGLPAYMIPAAIVPVAEYPLLSNGKINYAALATAPIHKEIIAPADETEERLLSVWKSLLGDKPISTDDTFNVAGGSSLTMMQLISRIVREFDVRITLSELFNNLTIQKQAARIRQAEKQQLVNMAPAPIQTSYPITPTQRRLWILSQSDEGNIAYNMPAAYLFDGEVDRAALEQAFARMIERHESLRTVFREDEQGTVRQYILSPEEAGFHLSLRDLREEREQQVRQLVQDEFSRPFDLAKGPLLRAVLYRVETGKWIFVYNMHHIISDGWSMNILIQELLQYYNAAINNSDASLAPLAIQYKDYAVWQQEQLSAERLKKIKTWWLQQFEDEIPVLDLPGDRARPAVKTYNGAMIQARLNHGLSRKFNALCQQQEATLFMGLLAVVNTLLFRYTNQHDIVIGSPVAGREHPDLENQIGLYLNTLAFRTRFRETDSFIKLLKNVRHVTLGALEHQLYPFDELIDELDMHHDRSRNPLFDVLLVLQPATTHRLGGAQLGSVNVSSYEGAEPVANKFDLTFVFVGFEDDLQVNIGYNSDIFDSSTIERLVLHLQTLLSAILQDPRLPVKELVYTSPKEREQIISIFNREDKVYSGNKTVVDLFEEQVIRSPDKNAIVFGEDTLSYVELNEKANQLAHYLINQYQIGANDLVGILLDRSPQFFIALMGILKSGGAYLVLDPDLPAARKEFMIKDAGIRALVTQADYAAALTGSKENPPVSREVSDLAYVLYTSGSTGLPKGVMIAHRSLVDYFYGIVDATNISSCATFGLVSTLAADLGNTVIYPSLLLGGTLHVYSATDVMQPDKMSVQLLDCLKIVPSHWRALQHGDTVWAPAKCLIFGGEALTEDVIGLLKTHHEDCAVYNHYGPTETTIGKLLKRISLPESAGRVALGSPFCNSRVYIVDSSRQLCPVGIPGEICISGTGVARGYLNRPDLTSEKFVASPFREGEVIYRTGDLGRWLPGGEIEYLGRTDDQVKIRGYRIEPGEIERVLCQHENIRSAFVLAKPVPGGEKELIAWYCGHVEAIQHWLGSKLPAYMIPQRFIELAEMPLTANGKIDRRRLPDPVSAPVADETGYRAPRTATEQGLAVIWHDLLSRDRIGYKDDFFALGGHSLKVMRLVSRIRQQFGVAIGFKDLFSTTVLEDQAMLIAKAQQAVFVQIPLAAHSNGYPMSSAQRRLWILSQFEGGNTAYNVSGAYVLEGDLQRSSLEYAFNSLITRHETLRTVFRQDGDGAVRQYILSPEGVGFRLVYSDLRQHGQQAYEQEMGESFRQPFDLATGPLIRAHLYQTGDHKYFFTYSMHHIISDAWSKSIFFRELLAFYESHRQSGISPLPPLRIQYKDYAVWQQGQLSEKTTAGHKAYWLNQLGGALPVLELQGDRPRPEVKTYKGGAIQKTWKTAQNEGLQKLCAQQGCTLYMGLLALVNTLLYRYTTQQDILIGSPTAGRDHTDLDNQIGFYVNTLVLRTQFRGEESFLALLETIKQITLDAFEHQAYPFDELINDLGLQRDMSRSVLFDVMVVLQNTELDQLNRQNTQAALQVTELRGGEQVYSKFDLLFNFLEKDAGIDLRIEYNSDLFDQATILRLGDHLEALLEDILVRPSIPLQQLDYLRQEEKRALSEGFNNTSVAWPKDKTVKELFEEQAALMPDKMALAFDNREWSYRALNERANQLAAWLRHQYAIRADDLIGIHLERSDWLLIVILGVLKSGAGYVPVDANYPKDTIEHILAESKCKILIDEAMLEEIKAVTEHWPKEDLTAIASPASLAYVMYTSGSTGQPKGVMVEHRSVVRLVKPANYAELSEREILLSTGAVAFDATTFEYWGMLLNGGSLIMCSKDVLLDAAQLKSLIRNRGVTTMWFTAGWLNQLIEEDIEVFRGLRTLLAGGDKLSAVHINNLLRCYPILKIVNGYGPTENTTFSLTYPIEKETTDIPVGRPINNSTAYILDERLQLCPVGVTGEICVGGIGLGRGYLNNEELTREKFIPHPWLPGERIYRTGDLGRWLPDGNIVFTGRKDEQVKIRGYRIEPGEIEKALQSHPDIDSAVVIAKVKPSGEKELVAYLTGKNTLTAPAIHAHLSRIVPAYMLPGYYVLLSAFPLTPNGKIDRRALPDPEGRSLLSDIEFVAPRNDIEEKLVAIWQQILGKDRIGVKDNFFEIGGHSLKVTQLISRINSSFLVQIRIQSIFREPTIENIAVQIDFILDQKKQKQNKEKLTEIEL